MSFFRPEALAALGRVAEPVLTAVLAGWLVFRALDSTGLAAAALLALAGGAAVWSVAAAGRSVMAARSHGRTPEAGVVEIDEGRIAFFGPESGGVVALDSLVVVAAVPGPDGSPAVWSLLTEDGTRLSVPAGARGAGRLPDTLAALPGFDSLAAPRLLSRVPPGGSAVLWRRPRRPRPTPARLG